MTLPKKKKRVPKKKPIALELRGMLSEVARQSRISMPTLSKIIHGDRRATPEQAARLEGVLIELGLPVTRWDLLYGTQGKDLIEYARARAAKLHA